MKIKINAFFAMCMLAGTIIGISAAGGSGRYGGDSNQAIDKEWYTGWNVTGDYTYAEASNRSDSPAYMKRVYARSGSDGTYSEWVNSGRHSVSVKDMGPYGTSEYDASFYWDYD